MATTNNSLDIPQNNGQLLIGSNGVAPMASTLTPGTGISIINGAGSITVEATGGFSPWLVLAGVGPFPISRNSGFAFQQAGVASVVLPLTGIFPGDFFKISMTGTQGPFTVTGNGLPGTYELHFGTGALSFNTLATTSNNCNIEITYIGNFGGIPIFTTTSHEGTFLGS